MVRLNADNTGNYEGDVTVQTNGIAVVNVPATGIAYGEYTINPNPAGNYVSIYHAKLFTIAIIRLYNINGTWWGLIAANQPAITQPLT